MEGNLCSQELQGTSILREGQSTIEHHSFTPSFFPEGTFLFPEVRPQGDGTQTGSGSLSKLRKVH